MDDAVAREEGMFFPESSLSFVGKLRNAVLSRDSDARFGVLVTDAQIGARRISPGADGGVAWQAVLVHDPAADLTPIVHALQHGMDWRDRRLPPGCRLLFGAGHDGGFALAAAASDELLTEFLAHVTHESSVVRGP